MAWLFRTIIRIFLWRLITRPVVFLITRLAGLALIAVIALSLGILWLNRDAAELQDVHASVSKHVSHLMIKMKEVGENSWAKLTN